MGIPEIISNAYQTAARTFTPVYAKPTQPTASVTQASIPASMLNAPTSTTPPIQSSMQDEQMQRQADAMKKYQEAYAKLSPREKEAADYSKSVFDANVKRIEDYSKAHSQQLYRAFTGDYYPAPWEVQNPSDYAKVASMKLGGLPYNQVKSEDAKAAQEARQMFVDVLGPEEGAKAFADFKGDYLKAFETRTQAMSILSPYNIQQAQEKAYAGPNTSPVEYFKNIKVVTPVKFSIGKIPLTIPVINPTGVYEATVKPVFEIATTPIGSQFSSTLTDKTRQELYKPNDLVPGDWLKTKIGSDVNNLKLFSKAFFEKEAIIRDTKSLGNMDKLQQQYEKLSKDYSEGKISDQEYAQQAYKIQTSRDFAVATKLAGYTSQQQYVAKNEPFFSNLFANTYASGGALLPIVAGPGIIGKVASMDIMGKGLETIKAAKSPMDIASGLVSVGMGYSGLKSPSTTTFLGTAKGLQKVQSKAPYALGVAFTGLEGYGTYKATGNVGAALGSMIPGTAVFVGIPAAQYELKKQYYESKIRKPQLQLNKPEAGEIRKDSVFTLVLPEGNVEIPLTGKQYQEVTSSGRIVQSYPRYKIQAKEFLGKLGIDYNPRPSYVGNPLGLTVPGRFSGEVIIGKEKALKQRKAAIKDLMNEGYTKREAESFLRYTPTKDILSFTISEGKQITTPSGENYLTTEGRQYKIPLAHKSSFKNIFGKNVYIERRGLKAPSDPLSPKFEPTLSSYPTYRTLSTNAYLLRKEDYKELLHNPIWVKENYDLAKVLSQKSKEGLITNFWVENLQMKNPKTKKTDTFFLGKPVTKTSETLTMENPFGVRTASYKQGKVKIFQSGDKGIDFENPEGEYKRMQTTQQVGYEFLMGKGKPGKELIITSAESKQYSGGNSPYFIKEKRTKWEGELYKVDKEIYKVEKGTAELTTGEGVLGSGNEVPTLIRTETTFKPLKQVIGIPEVQNIQNPQKNLKSVKVFGMPKITGLPSGNYKYKKGGYASQKGRPGSPFKIVNRQESLSFAKPSSPWIEPGSQGEGASPTKLISPKALVKSAKTVPLPSTTSLKIQPAAPKTGIISKSSTSSVSNPVIVPKVPPVGKPVIKSSSVPILSPVVKPVVSPALTPIVSPKPIIVSSPVPTTVSAPVPTTASVPVVSPVVRPVVRPVITPSVTPAISPTPYPIITPSIRPPSSPPPIGFSTPKKKLRKMPTAKKQQGYLLFTFKRKKPVLVTLKSLNKMQALGLGVKYTKGTERATFKLVPTTKPVQRIGIRGLSESQVYRMGYRPPVKKGRYAKVNNIFVQRKPTRMGTYRETKAIQSYKRNQPKSFWRGIW